MEGLADCIAALPDKPAFIEGDRAVSYRQFDGRVRLGMHVLAQRGVGAGDRVAIMLPNSITFFEVWAAAGELGASVVLVNAHLKRDEVDYIVRDSQAKALIDDLA